MRHLNLLFDSEVENEKDHIFNTLTANKVDGIKMVDINNIEVDSTQKYYSFTISGTYMVSYNSFPASSKVKSLLKSYQNCYLAILAEHESDNGDIIRLIEKYCDEESINPNQIIAINGNQKLQKIINQSNTKVVGHTSNRLPYVAVEGMTSFKYEFQKEKESFFMCYNRMLKPHRMSLLALLKREGILDDIDWTLLRGNELNERFSDPDGTPSYNLFFEIFDRNDFQEYYDEILYLQKIGVKKSKFEENYRVDQPPYFIDFYKTYEMNPYRNSYVNIVTETGYVSTDVIHITEKSLMPIYYSQIPLILANFEHNKYLKERYGFDLFEDIIDYSYDNEEDPRKRLFMFVDEVKRLNSIKDEIINFYKNNQERFENNKVKVTSILQEDTDYKFFKSLI
jgi:hypothetical protein